jgi:hypothetical protein
MKYLPILLVMLLVGCGPSSPAPVAETQQTDSTKPPGCDINVSSKLVTEHQVSEIRNLVKDETAWGPKNECTVEFDIDVDNKTYHLKETDEGLEQMASVCYYARERARKNLLLDVGGTFKSESQIDCRYHDK